MKISFVVAVYGVEAYIGQCIQSLQCQQEEIEILLVDDGSRDLSGKICDQYAEKDSRIKVIHQENKGVSAARNAGLEAANGEWICFIDGDDAVTPNMCQLMQPYLDQENDVCFFGHKEVQNAIFPKYVDTAKSDGAVYLKREDFDEFLYAAFNRDYYGKYDYHKVKLSTPCKFYRREFLNMHRIHFIEGVPTGEDCLFNLEVYKYAAYGMILDADVYLHRVWGNSVSKKYNGNAVNDFSLLHRKLKAFIESEAAEEKYREAFAQRCIWSLGFCCLLDFCHPENPNAYKKRKQRFLEVCNSAEIGKQALQSSLKNFRLEKKILFWLIQRKCFWAVELLCKGKRKLGKE